VRASAKEYQFHPNKIVIIGSSAGGHLAATLLTKWDDGDRKSKDPIERVSSRPDLGVLCYPVITMQKATHSGSRDNLLGKDPSRKLLNELSAELHVEKDTAPCFIWHTFEDGAVPVENAMMFAQALRKQSIPFELHCYEFGGHGLGMKDDSPWVNDCMRWLRKRLA